LLIDQLITLLFLIATFVPLVLLEKWIHRHLHGTALLISGHDQVALYSYALLLFPGVALHELSHWLMAMLLGVKAGKIKLLPERGRDGHVQLGAIQVQQVDVVRASLIGAAPLLTGSLVVLAIGY
jgi:Zn-dependent protease